jgi:hypothetical protein
MELKQSDAAAPVNETSGLCKIAIYSLIFSAHNRGVFRMVGLSPKEGA